MKAARLLAIALAAALTLTGCGTSQSSLYAPADDIVSYKSIDTDKTVLTVGKYLAANTDALEAALEAKFPKVDYVFTEPDAGDNDVAYMKVMADGGKLEDIQLNGHIVGKENDFLYDLSGETFTGAYNLSSLDSMNVGGKLYQIPISNTVAGISYNKTLFDENGWEIPSTLDDFYKLCDTIQAAGIRPFVPCLKYFTVNESVGFGLSFDDVFRSAENLVKYHDFYSGTGTSKDLLEPAFEAVKGLYDRGYITEADFSSSATELRQDLYAGKVAMMPSNMSIASFAADEKPDSEIGFFGYPTATPNERWMQMVPGILLSVSAASMGDGTKKQAILDTLEYLTTDEGQDALFGCFSGVSSLTSYRQSLTGVAAEVSDCISSGHIFFADYYASNDFVPTWQKYVTGGMSLDDFVAANDAAKPADYLGVLDKAPIGKASGDFTVLDTSLYIADTMREATGADIALILNGGFYTGNLARIFQGNIVLPERFVLKSVSAESHLTAYEITGANLRTLMEHPVVNGAETDVMYACSGLKMKYAPWADADKNVLELTLADGAPIDDAAVYTVAAWPGSIDQKYISGTVQDFPEVGSNKDMMISAIEKAGTIAPANDGRITLEWQ